MNYVRKDKETISNTHNLEMEVNNELNELEIMDFSFSINNEITNNCLVGTIRDTIIGDTAVVRFYINGYLKDDAPIISGWRFEKIPTLWNSIGIEQELNEIFKNYFSNYDYIVLER